MSRMTIPNAGPAVPSIATPPTEVRSGCGADARRDSASSRKLYARPMTHVQGAVAPGYEAVRDVFEASFARGHDTGAAFAAEVDGERVADLWGGVADQQTGAPWNGHTVVVMFSGTKGVVSTALLLLVDRGVLNLDAPVTRYWPEFGVAGKHEITVAMLASHAGGLPGVEEPITDRDLEHPEQIAALLAAQEPMVELGRPCYHAYTFGWLCGELVRRVDGRTVGRFVADEIAGPLGLDIRIGMPAGDPLYAHVAHVTSSPDYQLSAFQVRDPDPRLAKVYGLLTAPVDDYATPSVLSLEIPAANGVSSARAMASLYGRLARDGGGLVSAPTMQLARQPASQGDDPLSGRLLRFGPTGFELNPNPSSLGPPDDAFGHTGAGGSSHGAWPSHGVGFSYLTNFGRPENADGRARALLKALHSSL